MAWTFLHSQHIYQLIKPVEYPFTNTTLISKFLNQILKTLETPYNIKAQGYFSSLGGQFVLGFMLPQAGNVLQDVEENRS